MVSEQKTQKETKQSILEGSRGLESQSMSQNIPLGSREEGKGTQEDDILSKQNELQSPSKEEQKKTKFNTSQEEEKYIEKGNQKLSYGTDEKLIVGGKRDEE